jgi:hypothetical protein
LNAPGGVAELAGRDWNLSRPLMEHFLKSRMLKYLLPDPCFLHLVRFRLPSKALSLSLTSVSAASWRNGGRELAEAAARSHTRY